MNETTHELYWPYFCEENIWHRCGALPEETGEALVAFVSNAARSVLILRQRAGEPPSGAICWDYHVILLLRPGESGKPSSSASAWQVIDPDTTLPCPVPAKRYLNESFPTAQDGSAIDAREVLHAPNFRLIPADVYRRELRSDRQHMREPDGRWHAKPPPWPAIGRGSNLERFIAMDAHGPGEVLTLSGLRAHLGAA